MQSTELWSTRQKIKLAKEEINQIKTERDKINVLNNLEYKENKDFIGRILKLGEPKLGKI